MKFDPEYLQATANHPQISRVKQASYHEMKLKEGANVLDIGCGPGLDTVQLARRVKPGGAVTGIDADPDMVSEANARAERQGVRPWVDHMTASALSLPFPDNSFDACRCERVTQHLSREDGQTVVREALRVTRPHGRVVFVDTDWASVSVHSTNPVIERRLAVLSAFSWENGFAARGLLEAFKSCGMENVELEVANIRLSRAEIDQYVRTMISHPEFNDGMVSAEEIMDWLQSLMKSDEAGTFLATVNMILCRGEKSSQAQFHNAA